MRKTHRIILLSSATGGHAIPVLEIYKSLQQEKDIDARIIHSGSDIETEIFKNLPAIVCRSGKINRYQTLKNFLELFRLGGAILKSLFLILKLKPELIFSKGGFNGAPFLIWAKLLRIPYFLHESDSEMGAANQHFYEGSIKTFVSFPKELYSQNPEQLFFSGFIIRRFSKPVKKGRLPVIFITGGSQGARGINDTIFKILPTLLKNYKIIHHIGCNDSEKAEKVKITLDPEMLERYETFSFSLEKVDQAMVDADLIISRAGSTIAEISDLSKASILIPYPYAAADHQSKNAKFLEKLGAAIVIKEDQLSPQLLLDRIDFIFKDPRNAKIIGDNIHKALKTNGREVVCEQLLNYMRKK